MNLLFGILLLLITGVGVYLLTVYGSSKRARYTIYVCGVVLLLSHEIIGTLIAFIFMAVIGFIFSSLLIVLLVLLFVLMISLFIFLLKKMFS